MLTTSQLLTGASSLAPEPTLLTSGSLSVELDEGALRNIRLGNTLILQRIYSAVRDHNWATIPGTVRILSDERTEETAHIVFEVVHQQADIDFVWTGTVHLTSTQVSFEMDGLARSSFKRNRIGFCILHDADLSGQPCVIEHTDGTRIEGQFPGEISPHQPFFNLRAIEHRVGEAVVSVLMEGDTYEMEDQRNWSDASYKTYCTDFGGPIPIVIEAGTKIQQKITVSVSGRTDVDSTPSDVIISHTATETPLPALGLCLADESVPLGTTQIEALRALHLDHLRVDLEPASDDFEAKVAYARRISDDLQIPLEIALWLNDIRADLQRLSDVFLHTPLNTVRWLVFHRSEAVTSDATIEQTRELLKALNNAPVYGGTDMFFTHLNRSRPNPTLVDGLTYSTNPQVHAFDNRTMIEVVENQGTVVRNARRLSADKPIAVGPITLKMRSNPDQVTAAQTPADQLPASVDPRQMSLFTAVWTLGSIKHHAQAGAHSLTYFSTHGMAGIMDAEGGSPLPDKFPAIGGVYPAYWVLYELGNLIDTKVLHTQSSHPRLVDALDIRHSLGRLILVANYTTAPQTFTLEGINGPYQERELSLETMREPDAFLTQRFQIFHREGDLLLTLPAYTILILKGDA